VLVSLAAFSLVLGTAGLKAQTASENYGCLDVFRDVRTGRFDLTRGIYTDLTTPQHGYVYASPDGQHVSYIDDAGKNLIIASHDDKPERAVQLPEFSWVSYELCWSPDSHYVALVVAARREAAKLLVIPHDKGAQQVINIENYASFASPSMSWSPDSRYVSIATDRSLESDSDYYTAGVSLYGIDGTVLPRVAENAVGYLACGEICHSYPPYHWSGDGPSLLYVRYTPGSKKLFDAFAYRVDERRVIQLAQHLGDFLVYRGDRQYALVQWQAEGKTYAGVLDVAARHTLTLDSRDSAADLKWIEDKALVRWDTVLVWSNTDGTGKHRLDVSPSRLVNGPATVEDRRLGSYDWSQDGRWLVLEATPASWDSSREPTDIWIISLSTGSSRTLANLRVPNALIDGRFISPDGQIAVLLHEMRPYLLSLADGEPHQINFEPPDPSLEIHQIVWLPDNTTFVIVPASVGDLYLMKRDGIQLRRYDNFPYFGDPLVHTVVWSNCQ
jgi:Tol biopolymer transport system component